MEVLPEEVTIDILSRLPVKTIIHCKSVCKKWRNLVSRSYFVNLHLSRSHTHTGFIIHHDSDINMSEWYTIKNPEILKWVEIKDEVPLDSSLTSLDLNLTPIFQNSQILQTGSVNGLICLWQHSPNPKLDNIYICNPITREYIILPRQLSYREGNSGSVVYGFGVSSVAREYKVVRTYKSSRGVLEEVEVYTLGTGQWRSLGGVPKWLVGLYPFHGTFLNNHCHWIFYDQDVHMFKLCSFDLDKETFQLFPSPNPLTPEEAIDIQESSFFYHQSLAVLKGCLCKLDIYNSQATIWVMKEYGIKKSWHKEVAITLEQFGIDTGIGFCWPRMSLIEGLKDGTILMVNGEDQLWAYHPQSNTLKDTGIHFHRFMWGLAYHPTFLKLGSFESERVHML